MSGDRILLDLGVIAEELDLPRHVPIRRSSLTALRTPAGPDLAVLIEELVAAAGDDPSIAPSLSHGIARLERLAAAPSTPDVMPSPATPDGVSGPARRPRRRMVLVLVVLALAGLTGALVLALDDDPTTTAAGDTSTTAAPTSTAPTSTVPTSTVPTSTAPTSTAPTTTTSATTVDLPTVIGESEEVAVARLEAIGLVVVVEPVDRADVAAGEVIAVDPPEGTEMAAGDTVTVSVARRPAECNDRPDTLPPASFTDTAALGDEARDAISWAVATGLVDDGGAFGPDDAMSRAAAVTVLHRYMCEPLAQGLPVAFTDVATDAFYADAVAWASASGAVTGTSPTTFGPDDAITRAAFITVVWRALGEPRSDTQLPFDDVPDGAFYEDALRWAVGEGLVNGTTATTFAPDAALNRVTTIVLFSRIELGPNPLVG